ncbi:TAP42-like protein [Microthyrium microscopicum]|uniref:TAP42-like protein n=1 Tax=Microthyrium microscopicum TaxID=703497 RepID=A0A6A6UIQ0_9PEZI|nr:TAP42-like protein [Microthyrium microscopicum]
MEQTDEPSDQSLSAMYRTAEALREQIYDGSIPSSTGIPTLIALYQQCAKLISSVSLFSPNETIDDIASSELQYILVDYFLADALFKTTAGDSPGGRRSAVLEATQYWEKFLQRLDQYELLNKDDARLLERYSENKEDFEVAGPVDATKRREVKISRFREEKELKTKLAALRNDPRLGSDDAAVRHLHLANLALRVHETFQSLEFAALELKLLNMAPPPQQTPLTPSDLREDSRNADTYSERLDVNTFLTNKTGPILDKKGKPLRPFTLLDKRTRLQDGVFQPDHSLPTMSIDEYLEEERKRGGIIEGGGAQSGIRPQVDEDDYDIADEETMKARKWDDFKEENPRGSGNTMNRG